MLNRRAISFLQTPASCIMIICFTGLAVWLVADFKAPLPAPFQFLPQGNIQKSFTQPAINLYRVLAWRHINTHQGGRVIFRKVWHVKLPLYLTPPAIFIFFIIRVTCKKYCHAHSTFLGFDKSPTTSKRDEEPISSEISIS